MRRKTTWARYWSLDIETGDSEIAADQRAALERLRERRPEGAFYVVRIGYSAVEKIGGTLASLRCLTIEPLS